MPLQKILDEMRDEANKAVLPLFIDFSKEWHKYIFNYEDVGAEIVELSSKNVPAFQPYLKNALKISLSAGESKYLELPFADSLQGVNVGILAYVDGVDLTLVGGWMGNNPVANSWSGWVFLAGRTSYNTGAYLKLYSQNGGTVYISVVSVWKLRGDKEFNQIITYYPNLSLDGSSTYTYSTVIKSPENNEGLIQTGCFITGDGTNACSVDIYVRTTEGDILFASISQISSTPYWHTYWLNFIKDTFQSNIPYLLIYYKISGYGQFLRHYIGCDHIITKNKQFAGKVSSSASNASTTAATYTLLDCQGRICNILNGQISISVPATGGSAEILINGETAETYAAGASATFNIPDDIDIYLIQVSLAGDGTNAATASLTGLQNLKPYLVRR